MRSDFLFLLLCACLAVKADVEDDLVYAQWPLLTEAVSRVNLVNGAAQVSFQASSTENFISSSSDVDATTTLVFVAMMGASVDPLATVRYAAMESGPWRWQRHSLASDLRVVVDHCVFPSPLSTRWAILIEAPSVHNASVRFAVEKQNTNPVVAHFPIIFSQPGYMVASIPVAAPFGDVKLTVQFSLHFAKSMFHHGLESDFNSHIWVEAATRVNTCPPPAVKSRMVAPEGAPKVVSTTFHLKMNERAVWHVGVKSSVNATSAVHALGVALYSVESIPDMHGVGFFSEEHENAYRSIMDQDTPSIAQLQYAHLISPNRHAPLQRLAENFKSTGATDLSVIIYHRAAIVGHEEASSAFARAVGVLTQWGDDASQSEIESMLRMLLEGDAVVARVQELAAQHAVGDNKVMWRRRTVQLRGTMEDYDDYGFDLMSQRAFTDAAEVYQMIVNADGRELPTAHHALAAALHQAGDMRGAVKAYEEAIRLDKTQNDTALLVRAATAHMNTGMVARPMELLKQALTIARSQDEISVINNMLSELSSASRSG